MKPGIEHLKHPVHLLGLGIGSGLAPVAPGTFGTLAAFPLYFLLSGLSLPLYALAVLLSAVAGIWICGQTADALGVHDHPAIVWDEFVGLWISLFAAPLGWLPALLGFVYFRFFDVLKPWPIGWLDKHVSGGLGIMLDDILAGVMACVCLHVTLKVL
ncbi:MAG: phosphatidylglycerophosphatase A [Granulosicoccaceae bacterium]